VKGRNRADGRGRMGALACCAPFPTTHAHCVHGGCTRGCMAHQLNLVAGLHSFGRWPLRARACCLRMHGCLHPCLLEPSHTTHALPTLNHIQPSHTQVVEGDLVQSARVVLAAPCDLAHPLLSFPRSAGLNGGFGECLGCLFGRCTHRLRLAAHL